ncbi:broad substrate specificity ATP-binding cassette transporter ABCG2-like [Sciurus carolinensis]|uniref:broad substrate specificity ATP-binding cassette transporter ABCG2-like n=1 Tax=Sciurus carolinensis TaxID=30640 RepID=UPI001FB54BBB|nr:broad substrate specificity ATP-binding cassette transporter ABCG2-like [Sciurus carolinensis]
MSERRNRIPVQVPASSPLPPHPRNLSFNSIPMEAPDPNPHSLVSDARGVKLPVLVGCMMALEFWKNRTLQRSSKADLALIQTSQRNSDVLAGMTSSDKKGPVLSFHNLCYEVKEKRGFLFGQKTIKRKKLSNINGIMKPGLNAITGPTDGGKYLLLEILAARKDLSGLSGSVFIHEVPEDADFPHSLGYVVHDDVVMDSLTVRENLQFSASLRLPSTMTKEEKNQRIDEVIEELGLVEVADSKVNSKRLRKMTSIAMELIHDPLILFLDEPTTGLDWGTANHVFRHLKSISEQERTIIFSIHQPQYFIFKLFDSLTLLASGKLMYHGPAQEALEYFKSAGHYCERCIIAAESFLGVINVITKGETEDQKAYKTEEASEREESMIKELAKNYAKSSYYYETKNELDRLKDDQKKRSLVRKEITYVTSFGHQLRYITLRSFQNLKGDPRAWIVQIIATFILGLVVGATFLWLKNDCTEIQNRAGVLFFLMGHQCFSSVSAVELFAIQKPLFIHEHISGYYRVSSYFFGNILSDLLSRRFLPSFIFTCILYFMVGSKPTVEAFFIMVFTLMMVAFASISMALAIGADHTTRRVMDIYFICMLIVSGLTLFWEPWLLRSCGFSTSAILIMALRLCSIMNFWNETSVQHSVQHSALNVPTT